MKSYVIIFEIDGVIANEDGEAIQAGAVLYNMLVTQAHIVGHSLQHMEQTGADTEGGEIPFVDIVTKRPERLREETVQWFVDNGLLAPRAMHMRKDLDTREDWRIKSEQIREIYSGKDEVFAMFEGNSTTARNFLACGVSCYYSGILLEKPKSMIHLN